MNAIKLISNTNASSNMNVKIYIGDDLVANYSVAGNSKESDEKIVELTTNKTGKVKIVFTPDSGKSVFVKSIAINEVK